MRSSNGPNVGAPLPRVSKRPSAPRRKDLAIKPVPIPIGATHPNAPFPEILPQHEFTLGMIAPKGSGKTTLIANLLDFYAGYFHRITVFSPTIFSDEKWDYVRKRPLLGENIQLKKFMEKKGKSDKNQSAVIEPRSAPRDGKEFDPYIPDDQFMTDYDEDTLQQMMTEQMDAIKDLQGMGATKHLAHRWLIIFDDLVGSNLFSGRRDNPFKILNTTHRHHSASILLVTQAYKELPKTVRTNFTGLVLFEIPNEAEVKVIYEENPVGMKREMWEHAYKYCVQGDHAFMYINHKRPKRLRVMRNFEQFVFVGNDGEDS
jgi:hypothetical protein